LIEFLINSEFDYLIAANHCMRYLQNPKYWRIKYIEFDDDESSRDKITSIFERVKIEANHHTSLRMRLYHVISRLAHLAFVQFVKLDRWKSFIKFLHYSYYHFDLKIISVFFHHYVTIMSPIRH
jgi:hypothetical protein